MTIDECCSLEAGHSGFCVWTCGGCGGSGRCPECSEDCWCDDVVQCEYCDGAEVCPHCEGNGTLVEDQL